MANMTGITSYDKSAKSSNFFDMFTARWSNFFLGWSSYDYTPTVFGKDRVSSFLIDRKMRNLVFMPILIFEIPNNSVRLYPQIEQQSLREAKNSCRTYQEREKNIITN